jgi:hypothetical protein
MGSKARAVGGVVDQLATLRYAVTVADCTLPDRPALADYSSVPGWWVLHGASDSAADSMAPTRSRPRDAEPVPCARRPFYATINRRWGSASHIGYVA